MVLANYREARRAYNLRIIRTFDEISSNKDTVNKLKEAYNNDISKLDVWVGMLAEDHLPGSKCW